jgi:hypothetical protein
MYVCKYFSIEESVVNGGACRARMVVRFELGGFEKVDNVVG